MGVERPQAAIFLSSSPDSLISSLRYSIFTSSVRIH
jgi:hypothetical protein